MISKTFDQGLQEVVALCKYFATNHEAFRASCVKEAHVRQSLIDPFFEALGWNVSNNPPVAPHLREVIPEDSLDVEGAQRSPDYAFRVGTTPRFFVEAKKCGVNLQADIDSAYQVRRYGWNAKVALSILTDFEELGVYDCTMRPIPTDKASKARILYFRYEEYVDRWRELWDVFSREAMWSGAFDQYAASKRKRGTSEVDVEFLKEIEGWRESLARNIALRNGDISSDDLNAAVQLTIDRVVFLRMAEDRGLESYEQLLKLCERPDIYSRFIRDVCRRADEKYNSGLFHFDKEPGVSDAPDRTTPKLSVDDKVFKPIIQSLYFAHGSPYDFRVMPVEILGTVYERFLGKVIRLTAGHQAKVEEKPEVRKAGGVYYTPSYIVEYIVKQTVGRQIEGKSPAQLAGSKGKPPLRVLDMACGSGSFLLGAYQCLMDHCLSWYIDHEPETHKKASYKDPRTGDWRLAIEEKKRILTTHLFGVDIDRQAVEVTKLSLLLKALEGENDTTFSLQLKLVHDRALPNLADNIKCGNSLVGPDYFTGKLLSEPEEMKRVNALDWNATFPAATKAGGFDCIIGNPPYIRIQTMKEWAPLEVEVYKNLFHAGSSGNYDIYVIFIEQGLKLLNSNGYLGFICPHKFFNSKYGHPVRSIIAEGKHLAHVVHFGDQQVFDGATTYTCLMFLSKSPVTECRYVKVADLQAWLSTAAGSSGIIKTEQVTALEWNFAVGSAVKLLDRLRNMPVKLGDVASMFVGLQTSADTVFLFKEHSETKGKITEVHSKQLGRVAKIEAALLKPVIRSGSIGRYWATPEAQVLFPYRLTDGKSQLISEDELHKEYPNAWSYLVENKKLLSEREHGKFASSGWYQLYPKNLDLWEQKKIMIPYMTTRLAAFYDEEDNYFVNVTTGGFGVVVDWSHGSMKYITGLLNSRLLDLFMKSVSTTFHGGYFAANKQFLVQLPIRPIDFSDSADHAIHDRVVLLVESMHGLHERVAVYAIAIDCLRAGLTPHRRGRIQVRPCVPSFPIFQEASHARPLPRRIDDVDGRDQPGTRQLTGDDPAARERRAELLDSLLSWDMGGGPARRAMCERKRPDDHEPPEGQEA
jgi:hypothetical protein